ncbi:hypothetical protein V6N11_020364 [Hibiscus sabdariffa]|uniref:RNase H type-1 domain-containing protein n=1 Tax=Hibiscus sabdariffa TaxID=183260 RepID=A0ABR2Q874_9ROSI
MVDIRSNQVTTGGVLRDENRAWIFGALRNISICSVLFTELWFVYDILSYAWRIHYQRLILQKENRERASFSLVFACLIELLLSISNIKELLACDWSVRIKHIHSHLNEVVDKLVSLSKGLSLGEMVFSLPSSDIWPIVQEEMGRQ